MPDYDVAIIGAGPGGYVAAIRAAQLGLRAALIERDQVGGLCLNWACTPSKALLYAAELLNLFRRGPEFGIAYEGLSADLGVAVDRSREIVARFVAGVETLLNQNKVTLIRGPARPAAPAPASPARTASPSTRAASGSRRGTSSSRRAAGRARCPICPWMATAF